MSREPNSSRPGSTKQGYMVATATCAPHRKTTHTSHGNGTSRGERLNHPILTARRNAREMPLVRNCAYLSRLRRGLPLVPNCWPTSRMDTHPGAKNRGSEHGPCLQAFLTPQPSWPTLDPCPTPPPIWVGLGYYLLAGIPPSFAVSVRMRSILTASPCCCAVTHSCSVRLARCDGMLIRHGARRLKLTLTSCGQHYSCS